MQICVQYCDNVLYLRLRGELDEHSAIRARKEADKIAEEYLCGEKAVLDLSDVSFMDSTGIGFLIGRYKKFRQFGVATYLTNPSLATDKILSMSGVYSLMPKI